MQRDNRIGVIILLEVTILRPRTRGGIKYCRLWRAWLKCGALAGPGNAQNRAAESIGITERIWLGSEEERRIPLAEISA